MSICCKDTPQAKHRDTWVDNVKVFACVFVVLGHFFQSMVSAGIVPEGNLYLWFNQTIYYFHVPLFFICSGYLFQRYCKVDSLCSWKSNVLKKLISLGIPYIFFSAVTWLLKTVFSGSVNDATENGLLGTLFITPISPYWYLYCLFFIFLITPTFASRKTALIGLTLALIAKLISVLGGSPDIYAISTVFSNEIWFILGMLLAVFENSHILKNASPHIYISGSILFVVLSIIIFSCNIELLWLDFFLGVLACTSFIGIFYFYFNRENSNSIIVNLRRNTLPIFLMHTLFAAPLRILLIKIGIHSPLVHIALGIAISFLGPIAAAFLMSKFDFLNFLLFPAKYIRLNSKPVNKR